jgi:hypothetical protein
MNDARNIFFLNNCIILEVILRLELSQSVLNVEEFFLRQKEDIAAIRAKF